ncbi:MAG: site-2 protease family protein [Planctomycetota bacterium]|nr:site-2 protease family protein [Planctomycetota bacterium]
MTEGATKKRTARNAWTRIGTVRGVGIFVDPILLVILGLIVIGSAGAMGTRVALVGVLLGSVFLHEMGHAWMARRRGLGVTGVFLHLLPFAYVERGEPKDELRVALAGPAVSLCTFAVLFGVLAVVEGVPALSIEAWTAGLLPIAAGVNLLMGTLNLLPVLPLDGGRALRALLMMKLDAPTARGMTARVGTFAGVALVGFALYLWRMPESAYVATLGVWLCVVAWREAAR